MMMDTIAETTAAVSTLAACATPVALADRLACHYGHLPTESLLDAVIHRAFPGRIALVSSFGTDSAVLLHLVATVAPAVPVLFIETGKLFGETLRYRDQLVQRLGLTDVRTIRPEPTALAAADPREILWSTDPDACCRVRKVEPLARGLSGFEAWISGRKRYQGESRAVLPVFEADDQGRIKVNPLAGWTRDQLLAYRDRHALPAHPLEADGFLSIGCMPCTDRVAPGEDQRAGRWRGRDKTECGIHRPGTADRAVR